MRRDGRNVGGHTKYTPESATSTGRQEDRPDISPCGQAPQSSTVFGMSAVCLAVSRSFRTGVATSSTMKTGISLQLGFPYPRGRHQSQAIVAWGVDYELGPRPGPRHGSELNIFRSAFPTFGMLHRQFAVGFSCRAIGFYEVADDFVDAYCVTEFHSRAFQYVVLLGI